MEPPADTSARLTSGYQFPAHYSFPPFFTLQPNVTTLARQLALWSDLVQSYCAAHKIFRLSLSSAVSDPLFNHAKISRRLDVISIRRVLDYMASSEGDRRAEWIGSANKKGPVTEGSSAWIFWKRPQEWGDQIFTWVVETGQRGTVLTTYELREGDAVQNQLWTGMDEDMFRKCLDELCKSGKAQVFGEGDGSGVKFF